MLPVLRATLFGGDFANFAVPKVVCENPKTSFT